MAKHSFTIFAGRMAEKKNKGFALRLRNKYRLVIMNDETFEEKVWLRLSPLNLFIVVGTILLSLITLVIYLIAFTPLREYIPGYADLNMQKNVYRLSILADSLQRELEYKDQYMENINGIIQGRIREEDTLKEKPQVKQRIDPEKLPMPSKEDSELRALVEAEDRYELMHRDEKTSGNSGVSSFLFFTPIKGTVTNKFNIPAKHFGIDVVAAPNEAIKSTLDGTVVFSNWTSETGYVIGIQHSNNYLSLYKHCSALLKKTGAFVKAGEAVAIIGNSGEQSTGPHLHFELWQNGAAINPADYISF